LTTDVLALAVGAEEKGRGFSGLFCFFREIQMRNPPLPEGVFKPKPTSIESRHDATTKAARAIIDSEAMERETKTERLRAERLALEAKRAASPEASKPVARRGRTRSPAKAAKKP